MKVVSSALRTGRLYSTENVPGTHFSYMLIRPQGHNAAGRFKSMKFQLHHRESNPQPSDLKRSASVNCALACPPKSHTVWNYNLAVVAFFYEIIF